LTCISIVDSFFINYSVSLLSNFMSYLFDPYLLFQNHYYYFYPAAIHFNYSKTDPSESQAYFYFAH